MIFRAVTVASVLVVAPIVQAQTGAFVVRLGTDTIAVERFQRTGDRIEGTVVRHTPSAIASAWAARDASGQAMGPASTRDTVRATIGSATIMIDYGRPARRGREIWGRVVPYDTTWRSGANAATQFRTDKDLDIGGVHVPAGFYTLWLLPTSKAAWLIVNKQTGQWGTAHDRSQDIARIPLEILTGLPEAERFTIDVQGDVIRMFWDRAGYSVRIKPKH